MDSENKFKQGISEIWKGTKKGVGTFIDAGKQEVEKRNHIKKFNDASVRFLMVDFDHNDYIHAQVHEEESSMIVLSDKNTAVFHPGLYLLDKDNTFYEVVSVESHTLPVDGPLVHELEAMKVRFQKI